MLSVICSSTPHHPPNPPRANITYDVYWHTMLQNGEAAFPLDYTLLRPCFYALTPQINVVNREFNPFLRARYI
jgi:hypothetical protein